MTTMNGQYPPIKPATLSVGDHVMLIAPSHAIHLQQLQDAIARLEALGLYVKVANNILDRYGYFAGTVEKRVHDIHEGFKDPEVKALIAVRGGSGASLLLEHLDYELIRKHPKIFLGSSDITALLLAIQQRTGLITFHGPNAGAKWPSFTVNYFKKLIFEGKSIPLSNPIGNDDDLIQTHYRTITINEGRAQGKLYGGNLTVLTALIGSTYFPKNWHNAILFIEDVGEAVYRIDRMLAQLHNAGVLSQCAGFIGGTFTNCQPNSMEDFQITDVLRRYLQPLKIPAFTDALFGHQDKQFILGQGLTIAIDATRGIIEMLETATTQKS